MRASASKAAKAWWFREGMVVVFMSFIGLEQGTTGQFRVLKTRTIMMGVIL
jgi:hypothetical protein